MTEYWIKALAAAGLAFSIGYIAMLADAESQVPPLVPSEYDKKLLRLERRGTDAAYSNRIALLYTNWMTDTSEASQDRALRGHRKAREIYIKIMTGLDERDPEGKEHEPSK